MAWINGCYFCHENIKGTYYVVNESQSKWKPFEEKEEEKENVKTRILEKEKKNFEVQTK